jgi:hypothetical protein
VIVSMLINYLKYTLVECTNMFTNLSKLNYVHLSIEFMPRVKGNSG